MRPPRSDAIVFFGATGDLAYKQIFPALLGLVRDEGLDVPIIGMGRAGWSLDQFQARAADSLRANGDAPPDAAQRLLGLLRYVGGNYDDAETFKRLRATLGDAQDAAALPRGAAQPVRHGGGCARRLGLRQGRAPGDREAVRPQPRPARTLSRLLAQNYPEEAIFRIDHYLGKEPVQNILYTRFANSMFEPIWNRDHISIIQITMAENFGVEDRGRFYDETGAIRDVVQNHMLQVLANLTMDPPTGEEHEATRDQKAALLKAVRPLDPAHVVRGQYVGYQACQGVRPRSTVRDLRGGAAVHRDLALGGRADLHPCRQRSCR